MYVPVFQNTQFHINRGHLYFVFAFEPYYEELPLPNLNKILVSNTISIDLLYSMTAILRCHPKQTTDTASLS